MTKKEQAIKQYAELLNISIEEATQLYEDDENDYIGEEGEELTTKAKEIRRYEKAEAAEKKPKREIKLDDAKVEIISFLAEALQKGGYEASISNPQREIVFGEYSLTLTKHRPKK